MTSGREEGGEVERAGGRISLLSALAANLAIALAKGLAFAATGSTAMLAEALHSAADTSKQLFLFIGRVRARARADRTHPFGYGPEQYYWALLVAIVLFPLGAAYTLFESIRKLAEPEPMTRPAWAIATVLAGFLFEGLSLCVAIRQARRASGGRRSLWRYARPGARTSPPSSSRIWVRSSGSPSRSPRSLRRASRETRATTLSAASRSRCSCSPWPASSPSG